MAAAGFRLTALLVVSLIAVVGGIGFADDRVPVEFWPHIHGGELQAMKLPLTPPEGWVRTGAALNGEENVRLTFALKHRDSDLLQERLLAVSTPQSPKYGRYLSEDEVTALVALPDEIVHKIISWIEAFPVLSIDITRNRDFITVDAAVEIAEQMLACEYEEFEHRSSGTTILRCASKLYTLPSFIAQHVAFVGGVIRFPNIRDRLVITADSFGTMDAAVPPTTPDLIRKLYNITVPSAPSKNLQSVVSFLGQFYSPSDLAQFQLRFGTPSAPIEKTWGPNDPSNPGVEASLDVQYLTGVTGAGLGNRGTNIRTWVYSTAGNRSHDDEPFLRWLVFLSNQSLDSIPYVFSISYQDYEYYVSTSYMQRVSDEFAKFGLKGRTFVTGSGDWGVGCQSDFNSCTKFVADFPSCSPNIVSTGATYLPTTLVQPSEQKGIYFSSGGFSWYFRRPSYQSGQVAAFLLRNKISPSFFDPAGRAFPDVSAIGWNFQVFVNGAVMPVAGTSASTPTFAAILSLINSLRIKANKPTLGFVNPFLYQAASAFTDITECDPQTTGCCTTGFSCMQGWDPYTGLGTPDFGVLAKLAMDDSLFNFPE